MEYMKSPKIEGFLFVFDSCYVEIKGNIYTDIGYDFLSLIGTFQEDSSWICKNPILIDIDFKKELISLMNIIFGENKEKFKLLKVIKVQKNKYFFVYPFTVDSLLLKNHISDYMHYLGCLNDSEGNHEKALIKYNQNKSFIKDDLGELLDNYDVIAIDTNINHKEYIGEPNKKKRVCRFCYKSVSEGANFKKIAHAIPENIGNKSIILNEECDECNDFFGRIFESDFLALKEINTAFFGVKGKKGNREFNYEGGSISNKDGVMNIKVFEDLFEKNDKEEIQINLGKNLKLVNLINIYKMFVKMTLSLLNDKHSSELEYLNKTKKWLRDGLVDPTIKLPKIAITGLFLDDSVLPKIFIYIRKNDDQNLPHIFSEFHYCGEVYVYLIPFSSKDKKNFSDFNIDSKLWGICNHYNKLKWSFNSFSSDNKKYVAPIIKLQKATSFLKS